jgi:hypothetical protein
MSGWVLYICVINNGSSVKAQGSRARAQEEKEKLPRSKIDFYLFFIWQAIVRGQLFLQWTFFIFSLWLSINHKQLRKEVL